MRTRDRVLQRLCWALSAFLVLHTVVPIAWAQSQRSRPEPIVSATEILHLADRVRRLEELRIDARLSVLETISDEVRETRRINYGIVATVVGNLLLTAIQIRGQKRRRRSEDQDDE